MLEPGATTVGGSATSCCARSPPNWRPRACAASCTAKVADALIEGAAGDPDWRLVAAHYEHAERYTDAASAYQQASTDARRRGALDEARTYLTRAITQLRSVRPGPTAIDARSLLVWNAVSSPRRRGLPKPRRR